MAEQLFNSGSWAQFNDDRSHRYVLCREWDETKPKIMFCGLNPSTADETQNDPTIRRVIDFARRWGYGGIYMLNLFSMVSPYPEDLMHENAIDKATDDLLLKTYASKSAFVLCAWGAFKPAQARAKEVMQLFPKAMALQINKDGSPKHPLYCSSKLTPINFDTI